MMKLCNLIITRNLIVARDFIVAQVHVTLYVWYKTYVHSMCAYVYELKRMTVPYIYGVLPRRLSGGQTLTSVVVWCR